MPHHTNIPPSAYVYRTKTDSPEIALMPLTEAETVAHEQLYEIVNQISACDSDTFADVWDSARPLLLRIPSGYHWNVSSAIMKKFMETQQTTSDPRMLYNLAADMALALPMVGWTLANNDNVYTPWLMTMTMGVAKISEVLARYDLVITTPDDTNAHHDDMSSFGVKKVGVPSTPVHRIRFNLVNENFTRIELFDSTGRLIQPSEAGDDANYHVLEIGGGPPESDYVMDVESYVHDNGRNVGTSIGRAMAGQLIPRNAFMSFITRCAPDVKVTMPAMPPAGHGGLGKFQGILGGEVTMAMFIPREQ